MGSRERESDNRVTYCVNCGTPLHDDGDLRGLGCVYCAMNCPRCGKLVTKDRITYNGYDSYCIFCENSYLKEKQQQELDEQELNGQGLGELEDTSRLSVEELEQKLQNVDMGAVKAKLREMRIETYRKMAVINGERAPRNLDKMSDEELDKLVRAQFEKAIQNAR